jgi:sugar/nucleoside kinase (ribokinase family)
MTMAEILVSGLINLEITLRIDSFPIQYTPVRYPFFGVNSSVSGVGYNVAKALTVLGDGVRFLSLIGQDAAGRLVTDNLVADGIPSSLVIAQAERTAHSVILFDGSGRRQINVDLKDIQEQVYPDRLFEQALAGCSLAVLCNVNFSRPFLHKAKRAGRLVATDVHTVSSLEDEYNQDFMAAADILFMSDELLPCSPEAWARLILNRYGAEIVVVGLGNQGALLCVRSDRFVERIPAANTRQVVNTIGAGDALFAAFVHAYSQNRDPYEAIEKATVFASYKIGEDGASAGFLSQEELDRHYEEWKRQGLDDS